MYLYCDHTRLYNTHTLIFKCVSMVQVCRVQGECTHSLYTRTHTPHIQTHTHVHSHLCTHNTHTCTLTLMYTQHTQSFTHTHTHARTHTQLCTTWYTVLIVYISPKYSLIGLDLEHVARLSHLLPQCGVDVERPTLLLSECVLTYITDKRCVCKYDVSMYVCVQRVCM